MGIGEGLIYALAGGAEGGGKAVQNVAMEELKTRNALDMNKALLQQKEEIENMRRQRIADILAEVKTRVDDPTHPEGARDLTPQEAAAAKAAALEGKGMVSESEKYRQEENRLRDDAQRQRERADDILLRERRADIEGDRWKQQFEHQKRVDNIRASAEARAAGDAETKRGTEKEKQGLITGYLMSKRKGKEEDAETYRQELISRHQQDPAGMSDKVRYSKVEITGEDGFTKIPAVLDRVTGETTPIDMTPKKAGGKGSKSETELPDGVPKGSKQIGTSKGKPVYLTPEGKRVIVD